MNYFLGIFPQPEVSQKISKLVRDLGEVFDQQQIPVSWSRPAKFHVTLYYLGEKLSFIDKMKINLYFKKNPIKRFEITLNDVNLGFVGKNKSVINLSILDGGDELRDIVFEMSNKLHFPREYTYIPHLTLGRIKEDLTDIEYDQLDTELKKFKSNYHFLVEGVQLIKSDEDDYFSLRNFSTI